MGLLGYGSLTLTDLTDALPASLNLSSSLNSNIQVKEGTISTPDFTKGGVIITPSLFLGGEEVPSSKYVGKIVYTVNGEDNVPNAKDENGVLVCYKIEKNLEANCSIGARIENFVSDENIKYTSIYSLNPVNLILLEKNAGYSAFIESAREHFEEGDTNPIILTARLYSGINELSEGVSYQWTDSDGTDYGTDKSIKVNRDQIGSMETFICEMTNSYGTKFRVSKNLYDRTDAYQGAIISNGSTILTPQHNFITLTNQIWYKTSIINGASAQANDFTYNWYCLSENGNFSDEDHGTERIFRIDLNHTHGDGTFVFPKENFVVYCETTIRKKVVVVSSLAIQYSPVNYSVSVNPVAVFIPTSSNGSYRGSTTFTKEITFQLLDDNKKPLQFNTNDKAPSVPDSEPFTSVGVSSRNENTWDFTITLTYDPTADTSNKFKNMDSSKDFSISYKYLGVQFEANFQCVKNIQGEDGEIGASGYTVSLSNEFWMLAGGEVSATPGQTAETDILVMEGAENLKVTKLKVGEAEFDSTGKLLTADNHIQVEKKGGENKRLKFTSLQGLTSGGMLSIYVTFIPLGVAESETSKHITMVKTFKYEINYKGDAYSLLCAPSSLVYTPASKSFNSNSITLSPVCYIGGVGDATAMSGDYTITAQIDNGMETALSSLVYTTFDKTNQSIIFRLYRGKSIDTKKMVDLVTVPIIVSSEGLVIGGENLIPWTKMMPFENNKWEKVGSVLRGESYGFTTLDFTGEQSTTNNHCLTPKFPAQEDFFGKQMTFSAEVYCADWSVLTGSQNFYFILRIAEDTTKSYIMGGIRATSFSNGMVSDDVTAPVNGRWFKVYSTFTYPSAFENISNGNLYISFGTDPRAPIRIKKLKLEQGNVPSAWSAREGDMTFRDVAGTNLCENASLRLKVNASMPFIFLTKLLEDNKQYTLSIGSASIAGASASMNKFLWQVVKINEDRTNPPVQSYTFDNNSTQTQVQTFTTPSDEGIYGVIVYAKDVVGKDNESIILTLSYVKIEEGNVATSFVVTEDYLMKVYNEMVENNNKRIQEIEVVSENGAKITEQINGTNDSLNSLISKYNTTVSEFNEAKGVLTTFSTELEKRTGENSYLAQIRRSIDLNVGENPPYIEIKTASAEQSFSTKITDSQIGFYQNNATLPVAYLSSDGLMVYQAQFLNSFNIGNLRVSITESGVGFNW
nr:MAG TPA: hypothetical protein [Caudoviricetes sp.]